MFELFFQNFNKKVRLTPQEEESVKQYFTPKKVTKKTILLAGRRRLQINAFVEKGALREYFVDYNGIEHIIQFGLEGWVISDLYSFLTGEPATYNIDAIENTEMILITKSAHDCFLHRSYTRNFKSYQEKNFNK